MFTMESILITFTCFTLILQSVAQSVQPRQPGQPGQPVQPGPRQAFPMNTRQNQGRIQAQNVPQSTLPGNPPVSQQGNILRQADSCVMEVISISSNCFQNAGYQLQLVDAVISNGTITPLPPNANLLDLRRALCNIRPQVIQCIIPATLNKRGAGSCTDPLEFNFAENQVVRRLSSLQDMCGAGTSNTNSGNLPTSRPCIQTANRDLQGCYGKIGLTADMFISNETEIKGAIIGKDNPAASKFCGLRGKLFGCMRDVLDNCAGAAEYLLLTGYDHSSMEASIEVLCDDIEVYIDGLQCFQEATTDVKNCMDKMSSGMIDLAARQIEFGMNQTAFFKEYCTIRVSHLQCDMGAWTRKCSPASVGLKNEYECRLLPKTCQNDQSLQKTLANDACSIDNFARKLRQVSGAPFTRATTFTISITTIILSAIFML
ncbi:uncharacterized protein LOC143056216 isoform X1 [Mytilus galloprovincialis]|uniref:uncharacterized protein LOC143056216 isoform X1 n=1 Tax=Mytilus galloprovincialis TaxID=29158 RepID=UPI003F7C1FEA